MTPNWFNTAAIVLLVVPIFGGVGLWLVFQGQILLGRGTLSTAAAAETMSGVILFALAIPLFFSSLGLFAARSEAEAERWLSWLGRLRPKWSNSQGRIDRESYRRLSITILLVILAQDILLIPGVGEDRLFPLNQFYGLFSSLWYFYVLAILFGSLLLIYKRRPGGYVLAIILAILGIGTTIPDVAGLLPPSAPTLRTTLLELSVLPMVVVLAYLSLRTLQNTSM
jgi:hypothetical protein